MSLTLEQKKEVVAEVAKIAANAHSAIAAEYRGIEVDQLTELRVKARSEGVYLRVVKNSLAKRAVKGTEFECMSEHLVGPLMLAFSQEDPGAAARVIDAFTKENDKMIVKLVALGGSLLDASDIKKLAKLPNRDQAISLLMSVMRAPLDKLARTLNAVPGKLVRTLAAVKEQKDSAS